MAIILNETKVINTIYHLADIHIRYSKRFDEYEEVFENLYDELNKYNNKRSLILILGDFYHEMISDTNLLIAKKFLVGLANIAPVIIIKGNHDKSTGIASTIFNLKTTKKIYYLQESGEYIYGNISFGYTNLNDKHVYKALNYDKIKIGLYHGIINGSTDDNNFEFNTGRFNLKDFKDYDYVLLGDIHKFQYLNKKKTIAYSGSLIQQSFGESLNHGFIKWDLLNKKSDYIPIKNNYGFLTLRSENNNIIIPNNIPKNLTLRVFHNNSSEEYLDRYLYNTGYNILKIHYNKMDYIKSKENKIFKFFNNNSDVINLLNQYIDKNEQFDDKRKMQIKAKITENIHSIDYKFNNKMVNFELLRINFDNFNIYDEDNYINYDKLFGTLNINGLNASGKTTLAVDVLLYGLFGSESNIECLNTNKNTLKVEVIFKINNMNYSIYRQGEKNNGKVSNIIKIFENGINISGNDIPNTKKIIKDKLQMTEKEFISYCIINQGTYVSFLNLSPQEKKKYLSKILNMDIFDLIHKQLKTETLKLTTLNNNITPKIEDKIKSSIENSININNKRITELIQLNNKYKYDVIYKEKTILENKLEEAKKYIHENMNIEKTYLNNKAKIANLKQTDDINIDDKIKHIQSIINLKWQSYDNNDYDVLNIDDLNDNLDKLNLIKNKLNKNLTELKTNIYNNITNEKNDFEINKTKNIIILETKINNINNIIITDISILKDDLKLLELENLKNIEQQKNLNDKIINEEFEIDANNILNTLEYNNKCKCCKNNKIITENYLNNNKQYEQQLNNEKYQIEITNLKLQHDCNIIKIDNLNKEILELNNKIELKNTHNKLLDDLKILRESKFDKYEKYLIYKNNYDNIMLELANIEIKLKHIIELIDDNKDTLRILNENLKIKEDIKQYELELNELKIKKNNKIELINLENNNNNLLNTIKKIKQLDVESNTDKLNKLTNQYNDYLDKTNTNNKIISNLKDNNLLNNNKLQIIKEQQTEYYNNQNIISLNKDIINFITNEFIDDVFENKILKTLDTHINNLLNVYTTFKIKTQYDKDKIEIYKDEDNTYSKADRLSGYQSSMLNILMRLVFNMFNSTLKIGFLILDETFSFCDQNNISKVESLLHYMKSMYKFIFIISHDEQIKSYTDKEIVITRNNGYSHIEL